MVTAIATATAVLSALAIPLLASSASADTPNLPAAITVTPTPTTGLLNLQNVHFHVAANAGQSVFGVDARICQNTANIVNSADFDATGGYCALAPLSAGSDNFIQVATAPPNAVADLDFKVGTGTAALYGTNPAGDTSMTCNSTNPCTVWLQVLASPVAGNPTGQFYEHFNLTFAGNPDAPTALSATPGNTTATLSWTAPVNTGNAPISYYTITPTTPAGAAFNTPTNATNFTVNGLTNFTGYSFTVAAHNSSGFTGAATPVGPVTPAPAPPTNVLANAGNASAVVTWTAPTGPAPTGYVVTGAPGGSATVGNVTTATVTPLTNGTLYTFTVHAVYGAVNGPESAPSPGVTPSGQAVTQTFDVTRPAGVLLIGEACSAATGGPVPAKPYLGVSAQNCNISLGTAALNAAGTFYTATGAIQPVEVLDTRDGDIGWNVTTSLTNFTSATDSFGACNFGFVPTATGNSTTPTYTQTITNGTGAVTAGCPAGGFASAHTSMSATAGGGLGYSTLTGPVAVQIPLSANAGTYAAVMSFTLLSA
jgi:hypothetical protein